MHMATRTWTQLKKPDPKTREGVKACTGAARIPAVGTEVSHLDLHRGARLVGMRRHQRMDGGRRRGHHASACQQIFGAHPGLADRIGDNFVQADALGAFKRDAPLQVVTQVFTHTGHIGFDLHAQLTQTIGLANARELQQLRGHDGPGAQDHFAPGQHLQRLALVQVADSHRPRPLPHHRCSLSLHLQGEPGRGEPV